MGLPAIWDGPALTDFTPVQIANAGATLVYSARVMDAFKQHLALAAPVAFPADLALRLAFPLDEQQCHYETERDDGSDHA